MDSSPSPRWRFLPPLGRLRVLSVVLGGLLVVGALMPFRAWAVPNLLGVIIATTAKNQTDTATPFTIPIGHPVVIHCDAACYVKWVSTAGGAATTSSYNYRLGANETVLDKSNSTLQYLSVLSVSGTTNCYISRIDD